EVDLDVGRAGEVPRVHEDVRRVQAVDGLVETHAGEIAGLDDGPGPVTVVEDGLHLDGAQTPTLGETARRNVRQGRAAPGLERRREPGEQVLDDVSGRPLRHGSGRVPFGDAVGDGGEVAR